MVNNKVNECTDYVLRMFKAGYKADRNTHTDKLEVWNDGNSFTFFFQGRGFEGLDKYEVISLGTGLKNAFKKLGYIYETEKMYLDGYRGIYDRPDIEFPVMVTWIDKPCKEFTTLSKMLKKYCGKELGKTELYEVRLFGKRGCYGETKDKYYLCFRPKKCEEYVNWVRTNKTTRDILEMSVNTTDDIDTDNSIRYETECYGTRYKELVLVVKTPKGKVKATKRY